MLTKTAEFDIDLMNDYALRLFASDEQCKSDKIKECVRLLSQACDIIEDCDECKKACKKIKKVIGKLGKMADKDVTQITSSDDVEKEVQETVENQ